jgi:rhodanese-related sulfurtransferase
MRRPLHAIPHWLSAGIGLLALTPLACALGAGPSLARSDLAQRIERGAAPLVLDVRSTSEYASGHVPGAVHIPFREVDTRHPELLAAKDEPIVVYCAHGPRAAWAARSLRNAGYTDVVYLEGHMSAWQEAGLPIERPEAAADASER